MPKEWLITQVKTIHDSVIKNYTHMKFLSKAEIWSSLAQGNASIHKSFVSLVIALLILTISSSIGWLFVDAFAQMGSFLGDSTRGLLSNSSDVDPLSVITNQSTGLSTYTNSEYGFEFDFPSTWEALQVMNMNPTSRWKASLQKLPVIGSPAEQGIHDLVTIGMLKPEEGTYLDTEEMVVKTRNSQEHARVDKCVTARRC